MMKILKKIFLRTIKMHEKMWSGVTMYDFNDFTFGLSSKGQKMYYD